MNIRNNKIMNKLKKSNLMRKMAKNEIDKRTQKKRETMQQNKFKLGGKMYDIWSEKDKVNVKTKVKMNKKDSKEVKILKEQINFEIKEMNSIYNRNGYPKRIRMNPTKLNPCVPKTIGINLPGNGESINPINTEYYKASWKSNNLKRQDEFKKMWQTNKTRDFYRRIYGENYKNEDILDKIKKIELKRRQQYLKAKQLWYKNIKSIKKDNKLNTINNAKRIIKVKRNNKRKNVLRPANVSFKKYKNIWGIHHKIKPKPIVVKDESKLGYNFRKSISTNDDNPINVIYHEFRLQNKIKPPHVYKHIPKKRKPIQTFKIQTRIGNVFHANVNNPLHNCVDSD